MPKKSFSPLLPWVTCILASFFYVYDYFIQAAPSILTHQLTTAFHLSPSELGILGSSFFYPYALMQIPAAILIYRYGARLCLSVAVCISGLGVFTFGLATHIWVAIIARAMVGFGSAFAFIGALSLIACWFSHKRFALLVGLLATAGCLGGMVGEGPLLALVNRFQWRPTLMATGLLTLILSALFALIIRNRPPNYRPLKKKPPFQFSLMLTLLRNKQFWSILGFCFTSWFPVGIIGTLWGVPYVTMSHTLSHTQAAWHGSLFWIALALASPTIGWASGRIGSRKIPAYVGIAIGLISSLLFVSAPALPLGLIDLSLIGLGIYCGMQAFSFALLKDHLTPNEFTVSGGINNMCAILGAGISQAVFGLILQALSHPQHLKHPATPLVITYQHAMWMIPVAIVLALFFMTRIRETHCEPIFKRRKES